MEAPRRMKTELSELGPRRIRGKQLELRAVDELAVAEADG